MCENHRWLQRMFEHVDIFCLIWRCLVALCRHQWDDDDEDDDDVSDVLRRSCDLWEQQSGHEVVPDLWPLTSQCWHLLKWRLEVKVSLLIMFRKLSWVTLMERLLSWWTSHHNSTRLPLEMSQFSELLTQNWVRTGRNRRMETIFNFDH